MVSYILLLANTERGVDLPHKQRISDRQDALALLEFYEAVAEEKRIRLQLEGDGEVEGDRLMFRRAVSNLLVRGRLWGRRRRSLRRDCRG